jgi:hypothetical protein
LLFRQKLRGWVRFPCAPLRLSPCDRSSQGLGLGRRV